MHHGCMRAIQPFCVICCQTHLGNGSEHGQEHSEAGSQGDHHPRSGHSLCYLRKTGLSGLFTPVRPDAGQEWPVSRQQHLAQSSSSMIALAVPHTMWATLQAAKAAACWSQISAHDLTAAG